MRYAIGIDVGSNFTKGVLYVPKQKPVLEVVRSGCDYRAAAERIFVELLSAGGVNVEDADVFVTGCGKGCIDQPWQQRTEVACLAGYISLFSKGNSTAVLDIGGQSARAILLDASGQLTRFFADEKCASGGGRILEVTAHVLQVPFQELDALAQASISPVQFTTNCAVFFESELVAEIAKGRTPSDIAAGVFSAMASKALSILGNSIPDIEQIFVTGGVAQLDGFRRALARESQLPVIAPRYPQFAHALGAALHSDDLKSLFVGDGDEHGGQS